jgi:hypothetical protein
MIPLLSAMKRRWHTIQSGMGRARARASKARRKWPSLELLEDRTVPSQGLADSLYISDIGDNTVKQFDANTGAYEGTFVTAGSGGINVPVGIDFGPGHNLLVATRDRNPFTTVAEFDGQTGAPLGSLVPGSNPNAPWSARGIVRGPGHKLFVADIGDFGRSGQHPGQVRMYDDQTGQFLGSLQAPGFYEAQFNPRGVIIGPDGNLYVSTREPGATGGDIFKFNSITGAFLGDFITSTPANDLNSPGVPAFGPDGNLYVSSFSAGGNDTDKILEFNGTTGAYLGKIDLNQAGQPRAFAQQVLFGPEGKLFVPIQSQGEVRRYDVSSGTFDVFVTPHAQGGPLVQPWNLTFGQTNPFDFSYPGSHHAFDATPEGQPDSLYISDLGDHTVKQFDAPSGALIGTFVPAGSGGLVQPVGLDWGPGHNLLVGNNDLNASFRIVQYDGRTGAPVGGLVPGSDPNVPFNERGIVRGPQDKLFVSDFGDFSGLHHGRVLEYDDRTGQFLGALQAPSQFEFTVKGVVMGPDGMLYVAVRHQMPGGDIFKFNPITGAFLGDFVAGNAENDLNNPGVPTFGPDGNLYVSCFANGGNDTDKILKFDGRTGAYLGKIDLDQVGQPRFGPQQVLFGPGGKLFVPNTFGGPDQGEVRRYDVSTGAFDVFVPSVANGGPLVNPWFLTFGQTDPFTFAYPGTHIGFGGSPAANGAAAASTVIRAAAQPTAGLGTLLVQTPPTSQSGSPANSPLPASPRVSLPVQLPATPSALPPAQPGGGGTSLAAAIDWVFAGLESNSL